MRHSKDLDTLEMMRFQLQDQVKLVKQGIQDNQYMSPKTANRLFIGAAALAVVALPVAAAVSAGAVVAAAAGFGAATAVAALNKVKAANMESNRSELSEFMAQATDFSKLHSDVYKKVKDDFEASGSASRTTDADVIQYKQELQSKMALEIAGKNNPTKQHESNHEPSYDANIGMRFR